MAAQLGSTPQAWACFRARGYTIVELLVVVLVLSVLAMMVLPLAELSVRRDREQELRRALWEIRDAIDAYKRAADDGRVVVERDLSGYPPSLHSLSDGAPRRDGRGEKVYFLRRIPRDPFASAELAPEASWGVRSYESPAEQPQAGTNVYDVFSRSEEVGLNGLPLKRW